MKYKVLLSIGQFCDSGYDANLSKHNMTIHKDGIVYISGKIVIENGL